MDETRPWRRLRRAGFGVFAALLLGAGFLALAAWPAPVPPDCGAGQTDRQMLEEVVNQALERQLAPVKEILAELTVHRTSFSEVIGGLGYILGLFGLWAYCLSKRKKDH